MSEIIDVSSFVAAHDDAEVLPSGKIRCTSTGHEVVADLSLLQAYWTGKRYKKQVALKAYDFDQHLPWIVPHTKNPHLLYCTLTRRPISRQPKTVEGHVSSLKFKRLLEAEKQRAQAEAAQAEREADGEGGADDADDDGEWELLEDMADVCDDDDEDGAAEDAEQMSTARAKRSRAKASAASAAAMVSGKPTATRGEKGVGKVSGAKVRKGEGDGNSDSDDGEGEEGEVDSEEEDGEEKEGESGGGDDEEEEFWVRGKRAVRALSPLQKKSPKRQAVAVASIQSAANGKRKILPKASAGGFSKPASKRLHAVNAKASNLLSVNGATTREGVTKKGANGKATLRPTVAHGKTKQKVPVKQKLVTKPKAKTLNGKPSPAGPTLP
eukprot:6027322-Pleurochrysis_carterae.AAC.1